MFVQRQHCTNDNSGCRGDIALGEWTTIKHILWYAESGNLPHNINQNEIEYDFSCHIAERSWLSVNHKTKYNNKWEPTLYQPGAKGSLPTFSVLTRGQTRKLFGHNEISNEPTKENNIITRNKLQTRIWSSTLNTENHVHPNRSIKFEIKLYTE
jgi:hypothetical protein